MIGEKPMCHICKANRLPQKWEVIEKARANRLRLPVCSDRCRKVQQARAAERRMRGRVSWRAIEALRLVTPPVVEHEPSLEFIGWGLPDGASGPEFELKRLLRNRSDAATWMV